MPTLQPASMSSLNGQPSGSRSSSTPHTTAPVLEFSCLFTHDLKRKQKRWQDGRLKYHTYNKKVMVFDDRGNSIGNAHWREDYELADGDELNLEQGMVIVQVAECIGQQNQDLSELVDKRIQERHDRHQHAQAQHAILATPRQQQPSRRPVPLTSLLGTPAGRQGRAAIPTESPYEIRQQQQQQQQYSPPTTVRPSPATASGTTSASAKRPRREAAPNKSGYANSLFGATLSLSLTPRPESTPQPPSNPRQPTSLQTPAPIPVSRPQRPPQTSPPRPRHEPTAVVEIPNDPESPPPPAKRRKRNAQPAGYAQALFGTPLSLSAESSQPRSIIQPPARRTRVSAPQVAPTPRPEPQAQRHVVREREDDPAPPRLSTARTVPREDTNNSIINDRSKNATTAGRREAPVTSRDTIGSGMQKLQNEEPPKTELRLKGRKKRGLMLVREQSADTSSRREKTPSPDALGRGMGSELERPSRRHGRPPAVSQPISQPRNLHVEVQDVSTPFVSDDNSDEDVPLTRPTRKEREQTVYLPTRVPRVPPLDDSVATELTGFAPSISSASDPPLSDTRLPPGSLRLASLGRRGVRSKEVIRLSNYEDVEEATGEYINVQANSSGPQTSDAEKSGTIQQDAVESSILQQTPGSKNLDVVGTRRKTPIITSAAALMETEIQAEKEKERLPPPVPVAPPPPPKPVARIPNPATRGCKAAKKSDAAGQVPETALASDSFSSVLTVPDAGPANILPVSSREGGGPWSREAFELLGIERPPKT